MQGSSVDALVVGRLSKEPLARRWQKQCLDWMLVLAPDIDLDDAIEIVYAASTIAKFRDARPEAAAEQLLRHPGVRASRV
jgi:hypothetical protein